MVIIPGRMDASGNPIASALIVINILSLIGIAAGYFFDIKIIIDVSIFFAALFNAAAFITWMIYIVNKTFFDGE